LTHELRRAFLRGRQSETLYHLGFEDRFLDETVGELRRCAGDL